MSEENQDPEVLPKVEEEEKKELLVQLMNHFAERPDLLIDTIEKYDPGFIKRYNDLVIAEEENDQRDRSKYGKIQSYVSLGIQSFSALSLLFILYILVSKGNPSFFQLVAWGIIFAITQGGRTGFAKIINQVVELVKRGK